MFLAVTKKCDILSLTADQLRYIPKVILLSEFGDYVEEIWDRLPEYLRTDVEVQRHRLCREHWNRPCDRDHVDGPPPPLIKDCPQCSSRSQG